MSYDLHITRAEHWTESSTNLITLDELHDYFKNKSEFEYSNEFSITGPVTISISGEFFIWSYDDIKVPFSYREGRLSVSGADDPVIDKMKEIAMDLRAKVQGDEGELY